MVTRVIQGRPAPPRAAGPLASCLQLGSALGALAHARKRAVASCCPAGGSTLQGALCGLPPHPPASRRRFGVQLTRGGGRWTKRSLSVKILVPPPGRAGGCGTAVPSSSAKWLSSRLIVRRAYDVCNRPQAGGRPLRPGKGTGARRSLRRQPPPAASSAGDDVRRTAAREHRRLISRPALRPSACRGTPARHPPTGEGWLASRAAVEWWYD